MTDVISIGAADLILLLEQWTLAVNTENDLQRSMELMFQEIEVPFVREKRLQNGIIDFAVGHTGIECKINGTFHQVMDQVARYCHCEELNEVLLVTTVASHRKMHGMEFGRKPISVYWLNCWR